jgi:outer membrane receptor for ferrienterochelin and colicin
MPSSSFPILRLFALSAVALVAHSFAAAQTAAPSAFDVVLGETTVRATAEEELKQALGVSRITQEDLQERPPVNDMAELVRTMPGVNLTGNSASGQFGNNRQIDLRGMGPENTLILVDSKPVQPRKASTMGRSGEQAGEQLHLHVQEPQPGEWPASVRDPQVHGQLHARLADRQPVVHAVQRDLLRPPGAPHRQHRWQRSRPARP